MKLSKIKVEKLFGVFDHEIKINNNIGITIIIGENGLGKTVILEMIEAFFKANYLYFNNVSFEKLIFEFTDKVIWTLEKESNTEITPLLTLTQTNKNKSKYKPLKLFQFDIEELEMLANRITRFSPHFRRIGQKTWLDRRTNERLYINELIRKYGNIIVDDFYFAENERPKWFSDRFNEIQVNLIETQRLISIENKEERTHERTVNKYSNELSRLIKSYLTESTELSSKLDRTYPNRLIKRLKQKSNATNEDLNRELKNLEEKRKLLDAVGLIEIEKDSNLLEIENPEDVIIDVLMLYVEDSFEKIKIFDTISRKIEILLEIINKRFKHKKMFIDKENGFLFKSTIIKNDDNTFQEIPVNKLSSGEQNELVLFYLLLFKTEKNSLILIDEPEVSLHISWQNSFIKDLKEITKLNNLDVVIATHSPDIIANNWDLRVELKGLE